MTKQEFVDEVAQKAAALERATRPRPSTPCSTRSRTRSRAAATVNFTGFGKFSTSSTARRAWASTRATRPRRCTIPAATVPKFSAGSTLKPRSRPAVAAAGSRRPSFRRFARGPRERPSLVPRPSVALASGRGGGRARSRDHALSPTGSPRRSSGSAASSSSASTRGSTCCRSSCAATRTSVGQAAAEATAPLLLRDRRRGRAVRASRSSRSSRSSRRSAPTACAPSSDVVRLRALGRAARDRRRQARRHRLDRARVRGRLPRAARRRRRRSPTR